MLDYISKEQVEICTSGEEKTNEFYLPHHVVKKENEGRPNGGLFLTAPPIKSRAIFGDWPEFTSGDLSDTAAILIVSGGNHRRYLAGILTVESLQKGQRPDEVLLVPHHQG